MASCSSLSQVSAELRFFDNLNFSRKLTRNFSRQSRSNSGKPPGTDSALKNDIILTGFLLSRDIKVNDFFYFFAFGAILIPYLLLSIIWQQKQSPINEKLWYCLLLYRFIVFSLSTSFLTIFSMYWLAPSQASYLLHIFKGTAQRYTTKKYEEKGEMRKEPGTWWKLNP